MAKGWTSRSTIYGAPPEEASAHLFRTMGNAFEQMSDAELAENAELVQAEYIMQTSAGNRAIQAERDKLIDSITTGENARKPDLWPELLAKSKEPSRKAIMDPKMIRQTRAQRATELNFENTWSQMEREIRELAKKQVANNLETNFVVEREERNQPKTYRPGAVGFAALMNNIGDDFEFIDTNYNAGGLPTHEDVSTPEAAEYQKRQLAAKRLGDYAVQMAVATDDESVIDNANQIIPNLFADQEQNPIFGPDDITKLKKDARDMGDTARAEAAKKKKEAGLAFQTNTQLGISQGNFMVPHESGDPSRAVPVETKIDEALANGIISPAVHTTLRNMARDQKKILISGEDATPEQQDSAYAKWAQAKVDFGEGRISRDDLNAVLADVARYMDKEDRQRAAEFGPEKAQSILDAYEKEGYRRLKNELGFEPDGATEEQEARMGAAQRHLDEQARRTFTPDQPIDPKKYDELIVRTLQWDRDQHPVPEKKPGLGKRIREWSKGGSPSAFPYERDEFWGGGERKPFNLEDTLSHPDLPADLKKEIESLRGLYTDAQLLTMDELKPYLRGAR